MPKAFVSYARADRKDVDDLVSQLDMAGVQVWFDAEQRGGQTWWDVILNQVLVNDVFLAILSPASLKSTSCARELEWALKLGRHIVPVTLVMPLPRALPTQFAQRQVVDYSDSASRHEAALALVGRLNALQAAPPPPDPLPDPPQAPISNLSDLVDRASAPGPLDQTQQRQILFELQPTFEAEDPEERQGAMDVLDRLRSRGDLYADVARRIDQLKNTRAQPAPAPPTELTQEAATQDVPIVPAAAAARFKEIGTSALEGQLGAARDHLFELEQQTAPYTALTVPAELQVQLENQRTKVAELQRWIGGRAPALEVKELPRWSSDPSLEEIAEYLTLYCEPTIVGAVMDQVILAAAYRRSFRWNMTLQPGDSDPPNGSRAVRAVIRNTYEQVAASHLDTETLNCTAVYHIPGQLSSNGQLDRMTIEPDEERAISLIPPAVNRYVERNAYGTFYKIPYKLRRGKTARIAADVTVFHPSRSEEILVSYYPCTDYTATVRLPNDSAERFQLRVEYWHPFRSSDWAADEVRTEGDYEISTYRITAPLMPYQGLRIGWQFE